MNRNEYRRAFIMLRAAMPGYGGHVRLERRTLTGSMYFIVTAPQGVSELSAALVGQQNGQYFAAPIGPLSRDRRGQLALAWQFDPRAIDGRPLEAYAWVAVAATGGPCAVALTGNVEGSRPVDPAALNRAVCALFGTSQEGASDGAGAAAMPEAAPPPQAVLEDSAFVARQTRYEAVKSAPAGPTASEEAAETAQAAEATEPPAAAHPTRHEAVQSAPAGPTAIEELAEVGDASEAAQVPEVAEASEGPEAAPQGEEMRGDVRVYTLKRSRPRPAERRKPSRQEATAAQQPEPEAPAASVPTADNIVEATTENTPAPQPASGESGPVTAAKRLGLDITRPWSEKTEPLRRLFATQSPVEAGLGDGFTYVRSPMPAGSGYGDCLIGARAESGRITAVRCAVPARQTPEPPAGLEGYAWASTDGAQGYWVTEQAAE